MNNYVEAATTVGRLRVLGWEVVRSVSDRDSAHRVVVAGDTELRAKCLLMGRDLVAVEAACGRRDQPKKKPPSPSSTAVSSMSMVATGLVNRIGALLENTDLRTTVVATARTTLALAEVSILLFNPDGILFPFGTSGSYDQQCAGLRQAYETLSKTMDVAKTAAATVRPASQISMIRRRSKRSTTTPPGRADAIMPNAPIRPTKPVSAADPVMLRVNSGSAM
jgi:hypothetical protein